MPSTLIGSTADPTRLVARLWWTATRRRWRAEVFSAAILVGVFVLHGYFALRIPAGAGALYLTLLYVVALLTALFLPMMFDASGVLGTRRFDLLPHTPHYFFLLRLLFGQPLRVLLALSAVGWTIVALLRLPLGVLYTLIALLQLTGWTVAAAIACQIVEDFLLRRRAITLHTLLSFIGVGAGTLLMSYGSFYRDVAHSGARLIGDSALLLGSQAAYWIEVLVVVVASGACGGAILLGRRLAVLYARPASPPRQTPLLVHVIGRVSCAVAPWAPTSFGKELASVLRYLRIASGLIWPFLFGILAFFTGNPFVLVVPFLIWALHTVNLLSVDLPLKGITRYRILPQPISRVLRLRHASMLFGITLSVLAAALVVAVLGWLNPPKVGPPRMFMYPLAYLYGASLFLLASVFGNRLSIRYPYWYDLWRRKPLGVQTPSIKVMLALTALPILAGFILFGVSFVTRALAPPPTEEVQVGAILVLSTLTHLVLYEISIRSKSLTL